MKNAYLIALVSALSVLWSPAFAENPAIIIEPAAAGSISTDEGLEAWDRAYEVTSHPRCANCHVGPSERPMWSGPAYGKTRAHGMNVMAGESRIGAETIQCSTCHAYREGVNDIPHAAPQVAMNWQLAPIEADWFGKSSQEICAQLRDPERNGGRTMIELAEHLNHDLILHWAWNPGGGRQPAPYSLQEHIDDLLIWGVAGFPCAND
jgi:hypothetical protein|tara:strand:- start:20 stop:640 length:621 start_codon:yes stop_codon:yes gene_type:complete